MGPGRVALAGAGGGGLLFAFLHCLHQALLLGGPYAGPPPPFAAAVEVDQGVGSAAVGSQPGIAPEVGWAEAAYAILRGEEPAKSAWVLGLIAGLALGPLLEGFAGLRRRGRRLLIRLLRLLLDEEETALTGQRRLPRSALLLPAVDEWQGRGRAGERG